MCVEYVLLILFLRPSNGDWVEGNLQKSCKEQKPVLKLTVKAEIFAFFFFFLIKGNFDISLCPPQGTAAPTPWEEPPHGGFTWRFGEEELAMQEMRVKGKSCSAVVLLRRTNRLQRETTGEEPQGRVLSC